MPEQPLQARLQQVLAGLPAAGQESGGAQQLITAIGEEPLQLRDRSLGLHRVGSLLLPTKYAAAGGKVASVGGTSVRRGALRQ